MWVKVSNSEGLQNETLIAFLDEATDNPDHQFDAHKLPGNEFISIYTTNESEIFAIQAWKNITNNRVIGLGVDATVAGTHSIGIPRIENIDATTLVYLEDTETGAFYNLRNGDYQFEVTEPVTGTGRFFIHFVEGVQVAATSETCNTNDGTIQLNGTPNIWSYQVVNNNNETISEGAVEAETVINGLAAGTYAVRFHTFDGYLVSKNVEVLSGSAVSVNVLGISNTTAGESASFTATAVNATEVIWNFGDGSELVSGIEVNHVYDMPGIYTVTASASNGACAAVSQVNIAVTANATGLNQIISETVNVYPNPANTFFTLTLNKEVEAVLEITDLTGKLIRSENINGQMPNVISTSELANGIYLLNLHTNEKTETFKLSVSH
jgi:PKD repeat protein